VEKLIKDLKQFCFGFAGDKVWLKASRASLWIGRFLSGLRGRWMKAFSRAEVMLLSMLFVSL
jgi:hypothetical protein